MKKIRAALIAGALTAIALAIAPAASGASAPNEICVGAPPCFKTVQGAVNASHDGDVIRIGPGTFAGGVTIDKSVEVIGSGAGKTIIEGGGPVLTIGEAFAAHEPKVTISKVKVTGGRTTSSPLSKFYVGKKNVIALGGGIAIPPGKYFRDHIVPGATVKVTDSVISGNRVGPTATVTFDGPPCPGGPCPFAAAGGGGIDNWGALTLERTEVSDNLAAGVGSDAIGGGIDSDQGSLDLRNSTITGNRAIAGVPNGRFAEGGGIFTGSGLSGEAPVAVRIRGGSISENEASLTSKLPYFVNGTDGPTIDDMNANGGGAHFVGGSTISIAHARIDENKVGLDDPNGEPYAFDSALQFGGGSTIDLSHSTIEDNRLRANVGSSEHAGPSGSAIDINGPARGGPAPTLSHVRITGNTQLVTSKHGEAQAAQGGLYNGNATRRPTRITHSVISGNRTTARSADGSAIAFGGGILNEGSLLLQYDLIADNHARATAPEGFARGGGIWNDRLFVKRPPHLTLSHTRVIGNTLSASPGLPVEGGGLFTAYPVTLDHSRIAHNLPDQCFGCKGGS